MRISGSPGVAWLWVISLPLAGIGCSGSTGLNRVEGKVYYRKEPAKGVMVTFVPKDGAPLKTPRSTALTKEDGTFTLATGDKEGAPTGTYSVTFIWIKQPAQKDLKTFNQPIESRDHLAGAYDNPANSKFKVEIKSGLNKLEPFDLK